MSDQGKPKLKVFIKPQFDEAHEPVGLDVVLSIESPDLAEGSPIVSFLSIVKPAIKKDEVKCSDEEGELPTTYNVLDNGAGLSWTVGRQTCGEVKLEYNVLPSSGKTLLGLCCDQEGLLGSGLAIIPTPPADKIYRNIVEWDLSEAPDGTRALPETPGHESLSMAAASPAATSSTMTTRSQRQKITILFAA